MEIFDQFLTLPMGLLCLGIWVVVWFQRTVVEHYITRLKNSYIWNDIALPLGPLGTGGGFLALAKQYPLPPALGQHPSLWLRIFCGMACGMASGYLYRMLKRFFTSKLGGDGYQTGPDLS